jgi:hypothetical protein
MLLMVFACIQLILISDFCNLLNIYIMDNVYSTSM